MSNPDATSFPRTLADRVYNSIKESILNGELKPNQRIIEKDVATRFNISHTPVREALRRLASDGLIVISSHKESLVRRIAYRELIDIYQAMIAIDELALKLAFNREPERLITEIEEWITALEAVANKEAVESYLDLNEKMHLRICELSGNEYLYRMRAQIFAQLGLYRPLRHFLFSKSKAIEKSMEEFRSFLRALKSRDKHKIRHINRGKWIQFLPPEAEWAEYESKRLRLAGDSAHPIEKENNSLTDA